MYNSNEAMGAIVGTIVLFVFVPAVLVALVLFFQKKKYRQKQQLLRIEQESQQQAIQARLEVEEQTRLYIIRELHDNISTAASLVKINLGLLSATEDTRKKAQYLTESQTLIKNLITDIKQLSVSLDPGRISSIPFSRALKDEVDRIRKLGLFDIQYSVSGEEWPVPPDSQIIIYRVCQEWLHNIIKYANASEVEILVSFMPDQLDLHITDNGSGFDINTGRPDNGGIDGSGIINLHKRIKIIGGNIYLDSTPGRGTRCYLQIPSAHGYQS